MIYNTKHFFKPDLVIFISLCHMHHTMPPKKEKAEKVHSVRVRKDLEDWVNSKIESQQLGSWTHAIEWGLTLLKEKLEKKK